MASHATTGRTGTRVPFGDATFRANTYNADYASSAQAAKRTVDAYAENMDAVVAFKDSVSLSAVVPPPPQQQQQQQRQQAHGQNNADTRQQQRQHRPQTQPVDCEMLDAPPLDQDESSKRNSAASQASHQTADSNRASQYSFCDGFPNKKSRIGPWQLGKTLGKGSSARVRAARHCSTHQPVAVKIIAKKTARMTQSGSIAQLDQFDSNLPENVNGVRRMPLAIEREVAILKLIEHPNIVKLHDIWENRNEIYLILEYVENGDLFTYVSQNGALTEEASVFVFRQMMSAVQYCHAYNICHRDLKPENILLKADGQIKIADFGMAALHQGPQSHLQTSCGSPHYAAPELLKARPYRGDKADIWSMGVILFVMLAGRLPFDEDDMGLMLAKAKKGIYAMPSSFSPDAKDLVHRILQTEPEVRISMKRMWQHPLIWKYGYLDDLGTYGTDGQGQGGRAKQVTPLDLTNIDTQIFRQLRSMWHTLREDDLVAKLVSNEPNDQKLFYWLLHGFRERQQEDFNPTLTHSVSDYHHVSKPYNKKVSTRKFSQTDAAGHKRSVSRFTVISNIAETEVGTENGTVKSYDPYNSSIVIEPQDARASYARVVVHRNNPNVEAEVRSMIQEEAIKAKAAAAATKKKVYVQQRRGSAAYLRASRGSMSSIRSTRSVGVTHGMRPSSRHKRAVNFSKARKPSVIETEASQEPLTSGVKGVPPSRDISPVWNEDLTDFSCKIAQDLDDAFRGSLLTADSSGSDQESSSKSREQQPWHTRPLPPSPPKSASMQFEIDQANAERANAKARAKNAAGKKVARPESTTIAIATSSNAKLHARLIDVQPQPLGSDDRRIVSAPVYSQSGKTGVIPLPSIYEARQEAWPLVDKDKPRAVSAPSKAQPSYRAQDIEELAHLAQPENTIRVVVSPTATRGKGPGSTVVPQDVSSRGSGTESFAARLAVEMQQKDRQRSAESPKHTLQDQNQRRPATRREVSNRLDITTETIPEEAGMPNQDSVSGGSEKSLSLPTRRSWFKRQSKTDMRERPASQVSRQTQASTDTRQIEVPQEATLTKKKSLIFSFWKTPSRDDAKSGGTEENLSQALLPANRPKQSRKDSRNSKNSAHGSSRSKNSNKSRPDRTSWYAHDDESNARKIEPQQNWLSRLFRVKPATRHLCLGMSQRRARQEIVMLLRDWRRYGMREIEVDKERSIVFAKVGSDNYLGIREVNFACEIITVIEHGKRNHLCILRLTQERGSASSFHKVADTIKGVMRERCLLVPDKRKAKMMVKTLNS
ncbi:serine/threonine-protein kinase gin4 [Sporothrix epigloea]|uniref:non-specific serine/threonine protein kinase n=1 Tax=Sporothrix epigloea TaxID=1892477 RepID=A0ABP0E1Y9_9PEZI